MIKISKDKGYKKRAALFLLLWLTNSFFCWFDHLIPYGATTFDTILYDPFFLFYFFFCSIWFPFSFLFFLFMPLPLLSVFYLASRSLSSTPPTPPPPPFSSIKLVIPLSSVYYLWCQPRRFPHIRWHGIGLTIDLPNKPFSPYAGSFCTMENVEKHCFSLFPFFFFHPLLAHVRV